MLPHAKLKGNYYTGATLQFEALGTIRRLVN
jgi:hypothetical protein